MSLILSSIRGRSHGLRCGGGGGDLIIMMCWWAMASPCLQLSGWSPGLRLWYWGGRQKYLSCKGRGDQNSQRKQIKPRQIVLFKGPAQLARIYTERRFIIQHNPLENKNQRPLHPQRAEIMQTRPCEEGWGKRRERKTLTAPPGMRNLHLVTFWKNKPQLGLRRDRRLQTCASPFQTLLSGRWKLTGSGSQPPCPAALKSWMNHPISCKYACGTPCTPAGQLRNISSKKMENRAGKQSK